MIGKKIFNEAEERLVIMLEQLTIIKYFPI
jgi:hypothetical protein